MDKILVTIDKSHIITIGERLYTESVELLRELVNNSYDADADEVKISISDNEISVEDNGMGMNANGLKQYFNIGSPFKKDNPKSPKYNRMRIGEFGIGKFSVLSACKYFEVYTKKADFAGTVIFDKEEWDSKADEWQLPFIAERPDENVPDGTRVILRGIKKKFNLELVEKRLIETLPLKAPHFSVYLNGKKLMPRFLTGRKLPFLEGTDYGIVHGEIVILPASASSHDEAGILIRVKQVAIRRLSFGIDSAMLARITGEINADFLPLTSDRNDFLRDTKEYETFNIVMGKIIAQLKEELARQSDEKDNSRVKRALKEVTRKIESALIRNKDWCPPGLLPVGAGEGSDMASKSAEKAGNPENVPKESAAMQVKKKIKHPHLKRLTPSALIKKMNIGDMKLSLVMDHFGPDGPESFLEGDIIYVNRDHPLYARESRNRERHIMNIARLICQEISLMSKPRDARQAYDRQSNLLRDAFIKN